MSLLRWFRRRRPEPPRIEPAPASRLRLAQAEQHHRQTTRQLIRAALDEVDRTASESGQTIEPDADRMGRAVADLTLRYQERSGRKPQDALEEMVDYMARRR